MIFACCFALVGKGGGKGTSTQGIPSASGRIVWIVWIMRIVDFGLGVS